MKNFLAALTICALLCGACGCASESSVSLNVVDVGAQSSAATDEGIISSGSSSVTSVSVSLGGETAPEEIEDTSDFDAVASESSGGMQDDVSEAPSASSAETTASSVQTTQSSLAQQTVVTSQSSGTSAASQDTLASQTSHTSSETLPPAPVEIPDTGSNSYSALNYAEVKGVWISYIELADMLTGKTESQFRSAISSAYDNCAALGINTVYVHVRSHGDAYYSSSLYPWSKYVTGTLGAAPAFDPLKIMISEAHSRGLSFQAWINPLRACAAGDISGESGYAVGKWNSGAETAGKYVVKVGSYYYLNPAYDDVVEFIAAGAAEIAANYDVDGIHIDDYFYPTTDASFDSVAYSAGGYTTLSSFRLANCDKLVSSIYRAVKNANPAALFGVSCQGSIENNYSQMYADVKKWCSQSGFTDYIMPQIYYGFNNSAQPYSRCAAEWDALAQSGGIPLIIGLSVSKIGLEDTWAGAGKTEWITDKNILSRQYAEALAQRSYGGICLYSYRSIFTPDSTVKAQVDSEITALSAAMNN